MPGSSLDCQYEGASAPRSPVHEALQKCGSALADVGGSEVVSHTINDTGAAICVALYDAPPYRLQVPALTASRLSVQLAASRVQGSIAGDLDGQ